MNGTCLCGAVEFDVSGKIPNLYQCHCSQCRKQGGSASNAATIVTEDQFTWKAGQNHITKFKHRSGFNSHFCSICGSPVPNKLGDKDLVWMPVGLLESGENLKIVAHLHVGSKAEWEVMGNTGEQYAEMPGLDVLSKLLQRESD